MFSLPSTCTKTVLVSLILAIASAIGHAQIQPNQIDFSGSTGCGTAGLAYAPATNTCIAGGGGGGTATYTSSHTANSSDAGKLIVMNCASACALTLPGTQPSATWYAGITTQGASVATIVLGGGDTFNASASVPILNTFDILWVYADSGTSTNYAGQAPLVAGANVTLTPSSNGLSLAATATSSLAFSALTGSTNTTAAMVVGSGASINHTGTGAIDATKINGVATTGTPSAGQVCSATSSSNCTWTTPSTGASFDVLSTQRASGTQFFAKIEDQPMTSGTPVTLVTKTGAGVITSINLIFNGSNAYQAMGKSTIAITVNGNASPTISMPLAAFFGQAYLGAGVSAQQFANYFVMSGANAANAADIQMATRMPIPYNNGITITLTIGISGQVLYSNILGNTAADSWPYTEKLWASYICPSSASPTVLCGTATGAATPYYAQEQIANYAGANPGRIVGVFMGSDDTPGSAAPKFATMEGNYRIFIDQATQVWAASQATTSAYTIMDPNGNLQTANTGTTGGTIPSTWGCYTGATTSDNTTTWTATAGTPANQWIASKPYSLACMSVYDTNGNIETVTTTGTSGGSAPSWPSTGSCAGASTTDNTVHWICSLGSTAVIASVYSTGTEDYFNSFDYWASQNPATVGAGEIGLQYPVSPSQGTVAAFKYYVSEPLRFSHSFAVYRENGDSSDVVMTGGTTTSLQTVWWYSQDTN